MRNNRIQITVLLLCCLMLLGSTAHAQNNNIWKVEIITMSANGRHLAVKYNTGEQEGNTYLAEVWIYNLDDLSAAPRHLVDTTLFSSGVSFSPDSLQIALAEKGRLRVYNTEDLSLILDFAYTGQEQTAFGRILSFSLDGRYIMYYRNVPSFSNVSGADKGRITIWETKTGLRYLEIKFRSQDIIGSPMPSPDWRQFLDRSHSAGLSVYEFNAELGLGSRIATFSQSLGTAFNADNSLFALATLENEIQIYRTDTWDLTYVQVLSENTCSGKRNYIAFHNIHPWLACVGNERLSVWDIETGELLLEDKVDTFYDFPSWRSGMLFVDNRRYTGTREKTIIVWDANKAFEKTTYPGGYPQFHPNGELMAAISPDQRVALWNVKSQEFLMYLPIPKL